MEKKSRFHGFSFLSVKVVASGHCKYPSLDQPSFVPYLTLVHTFLHLSFISSYLSLGFSIMVIVRCLSLFINVQGNVGLYCV